MGCGTDVYCRTCRIIWYCGYGSYRYVHERMALSPVAEHEALGHDTGVVSEDFTHLNAGGDLMFEGQYDSEIYIPCWTYFQYFDLTLDPPDTIGLPQPVSISK